VSMPGPSDRITERLIFLFLIGRLPVFDPSWPPPLQAQWMASFSLLLAWGYRIEVHTAIDRYCERN
jgi:hypothetical protein